MIARIVDQQSYMQASLKRGSPPCIRERPADLETPISIYLKLAGEEPSFLLESVSGGEQLARYSFIGVQPSRAFKLSGGKLSIIDPNHLRPDETHSLADGQNPLALLRTELAQRSHPAEPWLPRFSGGLVGYFSYEMMRYFEPGVNLAAHPHLPDALFLQADVLVAFDHAFGKLLLIGNPSPELSQHDIAVKLDQIEQQISKPLPITSNELLYSLDDKQSNTSRHEFTAAVRRAKEYIAAGDIYQVVLSQRFTRHTSAHPFDIYRALRRMNPSPYMFFFNFANLAGDEPLYLIGSSPEMHVRLEGRKATIRPIAGTRPRGADPSEDAKLEKELLADPKEKAEHVMLLDLARNDLGRVCRYGSVHVALQMGIERYSHVMHLVSQVEGELSAEADAFDLLAATLPAGTVTGAPKIRAMQVIAELEKDARGPYAGAVGYFSYGGSLDSCITIRTLLLHGDRLSMQAGAGIVADSNPEAEYQETLNKLRALGLAVDMAEEKT